LVFFCPHYWKCTVQKTKCMYWKLQCQLRYKLECTLKSPKFISRRQPLLPCVRYYILSYVPYRNLGVSIRPCPLHARTHARLQGTHDVDMLSCTMPLNGSKRRLVVLSEMLIQWGNMTAPVIMCHVTMTMPQERTDSSTFPTGASKDAAWKMPGNCGMFVSLLDAETRLQAWWERTGREQEAIAIGHIFNWQGESAPQCVLIFDHQGKGFDFVFLTFYLFHSSPFFLLFLSACIVFFVHGIER